MGDSRYITADEILCTALDVGEHILRHGGEVYRVEDTINRICISYGAKHVEVFCITSVIISAIRMPDGEYSSQIRRVYDSDNNLYKLEMLNEVSRKLCKNTPPREEAVRLIESAKNASPYSDYIGYLGACIAVAAFIMFFGGSYRDAIAGAIIESLLLIIAKFIPKHLNKIAITTVQSFAAGVLSIISVGVGLAQNTDKVMIGTIMILIPGIAFGNSIRDIFNGDLISGALRLFHSLIVAIAIAFGFMVALLWFGGK
ncbi:MAG: threonine/serine exporter family protein [Ruminococcaceae bacterium]|nr:threonine/serine exporter family protein [Oscillospiraceae bacterium]